MSKLGPYLLGPNDESQGIYTGDARELAKAIPDESVDLVLVDPPYGINWQSARRTASDRFAKIPGDNRIDASWLAQGWRVSKQGAAIYLFTHWRVAYIWMNAMSSAGYTVKSFIVWDKGYHGCGDLNGSYAPQHEVVLFGAKGRHNLRGRRPKDVIRYNRVSPSRLLHPAQKPVELMESLIVASSDEGDVVTDWFTGSGTVPVAARKLRRQYLAFEIDPATADLARERVRNTQPPLFVPQPRQVEMAVMA